MEEEKELETPDEETPSEEEAESPTAGELPPENE